MKVPRKLSLASSRLHLHSILQWHAGASGVGWRLKAVSVSSGHRVVSKIAHDITWWSYKTMFLLLKNFCYRHKKNAKEGLLLPWIYGLCVVHVSLKSWGNEKATELYAIVRLLRLERIGSLDFCTATPCLDTQKKKMFGRNCLGKLGIPGNWASPSLSIPFLLHFVLAACFSL